MKKTSAYFISTIFILSGFSLNIKGQDTLYVPLNIRVGLDLAGPVIYAVNNDNLSLEGYVSYDLNEKYSAYLGGGYMDYRYVHNEYEYLNHGQFIKAGIDINMLNIKKSSGRHWAGVSFRYGISGYKWEVPFFQKTNYWGTESSSIPSQKNRSHFFEFAPGVRTEVLKNLTMGWTVNLRIRLRSNYDDDLKPVNFPGFGNAQKVLSPGVTYFISWNIPYKKKRVVIQPPPKEEPVDEKAPQGQSSSGQRNN